MAHPNAETDFVRFLHAADAGALKRALEEEMNAPRAECRPPRTVGPDAFIEIEKLDAGMGCPIGQQTYWIAVQWRTTMAATGRQLNWTLTRCALTSSRTVDDWFADPETARAEIENAFSMAGRRIAAQLLAKEMPYECALRSDAAGAVVAR